MRPENKKMKAYLKQHGIEARVKYIRKGSLKGCWYLYNPGMRWTEELTKKLGDLGFRDFDGQPLGQFSGNGGVFSVCLRGLTMELSQDIKSQAIADFKIKYSQWKNKKRRIKNKMAKTNLEKAFNDKKPYRENIIRHNTPIKGAF